MVRIWFLLVLTAVTAFAQSPTVPQPVHKPLPMEAPVKEKNFYLFAALEQDFEAKSAIASDPVLSKLSLDSQQTLDKTIRTCGDDALCSVKPLIWTEEEIKVVQNELRTLYRQKSALRALVDHQLRESGAFELYRDKAGDELLAQVWADAAHGIDHILEVYGEGQQPLYPRSDSISFDPHSKEFGRLAHTVLVHVQEQIGGKGLFVAPSLYAALALLDINHRDEAGRFEPMERSENAAAYAAIVHTNWDKYPYSVIIVPGAGPGDPNVALSPQGKARLDLAVERFRQGKAPFLLVSGGYVHPSQTRFCEAIEMKRYLVEKVGIPAGAILVDPHARHTTTNIRNAVRLLYRYPIPFDKPVLITTDASQSSYITAPEFAKRCQQELGYLPYLSLKRTSPLDVEMLSNVQSLHANAMEPLDP